MIGRLEHLQDELAAANLELTVPQFRQVVPESELIRMVPEFDGWIIGDDPATASVFQAGAKGRLRAAVKWGVGVDNVDFSGAQQCGIDVTNTPGAFSEEVADVALGYLIMLARKLHVVSDGVRNAQWPKPIGSSLRGKTVGLVGYGNIGRETARRLVTCGMKVQAYDPFFAADPRIDKIAEVAEVVNPVTNHDWADGIEKVDYVILTCALNEHTEGMIDAEVLAKMKTGVRIVNVSRGPLIDEASLHAALETGKVESAALEVFVQEPPAPNDPLLHHPSCVFGSHNGSNTAEAVDRASHIAIDLLQRQLEASA